MVVVGRVVGVVVGRVAVGFTVTVMRPVEQLVCIRIAQPSVAAAHSHIPVSLVGSVRGLARVPTTPPQAKSRINSYRIPEYTWSGTDPGRYPSRTRRRRRRISTAINRRQQLHRNTVS
jgi:hypothetical protein